MPLRPKPATPTDLSLKGFRDALVDEGFAYLGRSVDRYVDIRHRQPGRYFEAVKDAKGRVLRQETLTRLLAARKDFETARTAQAAETARQQKIAAAIAPTAVPGCRADLTEAAAIAQLADDFLTRFASAGCVGFGDLLQMGWSVDQLKQHGAAARAVADRRASRQGVAA